MAKIKIETEGALAHIYIDGQEIHDVLSADIVLRPNKIPELHMNVIMDGRIEISDGEAYIHDPVFLALSN